MSKGSTKEILESIKRTRNFEGRRYAKQGGGNEGVNSSINKGSRKISKRKVFDRKVFSNVHAGVTTRVNMGS